MASKCTLARYPSSLFSFLSLLSCSFAHCSFSQHGPGRHAHPQVTNASPFCFSLFRYSQRKFERHGHMHTHTHTMYTLRFLLNLRGIRHGSLSYFWFVKLDTIPNQLIIFSYHVLFRAYMANALCARSLDTWQTSLALFLSLTLSAHPFPFPSSPP